MATPTRLTPLRAPIPGCGAQGLHTDFDEPAPGLPTWRAPAGSLVLFNGPDLWHSGTFNYSPAARLALTACFAPGPAWRLND